MMDLSAALVQADRALESGDDRAAAAALDRAWGLEPSDPRVTALRAEVLDRLEVREHGLVWRYVPAGPFRMGSDDGDPDERPVHTVDLDGFWIMDVPMTWADDCRLRGWSAPPDAAPDSWPEGSSRFTLAQHHKVRRQYCEDEGGGYATRPLVAVAWQDAEALAAHLSTEAVQYGLPTESQWEKAARGGRIGARFPWGDGAPEPGWCDHDALHAFSIRDPRTTWRNGYGLYAMAGTVAEWTVTPYDALAYRGRPVSPEATERVLRGGSWADSLAGCTVSFRTSRASRSQLDEGWAPNLAPTLGYRLIRVD